MAKGLSERLFPKEADALLRRLALAHVLGKSRGMSFFARVSRPEPSPVGQEGEDPQPRDGRPKPSTPTEQADG